MQIYKHSPHPQFIHSFDVVNHLQWQTKFGTTAPVCALNWSSGPNNYMENLIHWKQSRILLWSSSHTSKHTLTHTQSVDKALSTQNSCEVPPIDGCACRKVLLSSRHFLSDIRTIWNWKVASERGTSLKLKKTVTTTAKQTLMNIPLVWK